MAVERENLYRFPWSKTDNPGAWIEVTDICDLSCPSCFRHHLEGHRSLDVIKEEILTCQRHTNCERIAIAGGEPLIYPEILEVVEFISKQGMKPVLMTNGHSLTSELACEFRKAGLAQFFFHVDSGQQRPGWEGKNEIELNELRQYYADMVWNLRGVLCGYNLTITRKNLDYLPDIVHWSSKNIQKVQNLTLIAVRALLVSNGIEYKAGNESVDVSGLSCSTDNSSEIDITSDEMLEVLQRANPNLLPCAFLNGTVNTDTNKFLVIVPIGCKHELYGVAGAKTVELNQTLHHFCTGRYTSFTKAPRPSKSIFLLSLIDSKVRTALKNLLSASVRNPLRLFQKVHLQCVNLVQPTEIIEGEKNFCDGCLNLIPWKGKMVHSCVLDEYRMFGKPIRPSEY